MNRIERAKKAKAEAEAERRRLEEEAAARRPASPEVQDFDVFARQSGASVDDEIMDLGGQSGNTGEEEEGEYAYEASEWLDRGKAPVEQLEVAPAAWDQGNWPPVSSGTDFSYMAPYGFHHLYPAGVHEHEDSRQGDRQVYYDPPEGVSYESFAERQEDLFAWQRELDPSFRPPTVRPRYEILQYTVPPSLAEVQQTSGRKLSVEEGFSYLEENLRQLQAYVAGGSDSVLMTRSETNALFAKLFSEIQRLRREIPQDRISWERVDLRLDTLEVKCNQLREEHNALNRTAMTDHYQGREDHQSLNNLWDAHRSLARRVDEFQRPWRRNPSDIFELMIQHIWPGGMREVDRFRLQHHRSSRDVILAMAEKGLLMPSALEDPDVLRMVDETVDTLRSHIYRSEAQRRSAGEASTSTAGGQRAGGNQDAPPQPGRRSVDRGRGPARARTGRRG